MNEPTCQEIQAEDDWPEIQAEDFAYLCGPRDWPDPCPWCGGRLLHNSQCVTHDWKPVLPFGKHKGKKVCVVSVDYLRWLLANCNKLNPELRDAIESRVNGTK